MALANGGLLALYKHIEILVNSSLKATKKLAMVISKIQVSNPAILALLFRCGKQLTLSQTSLVFSSTGQRPASYCHGVVSVMRLSIRPSVRSCVRASVNSSFKKLLLRNYLLDFYKISQECSLGGPLSNSFK